MNFERVITEATPLFLEGMKITVYVSVVSILIGMALGLVACLMKLSHNPVLRGIAGFYIWIIRGTPMIVQAYFFYFGLTAPMRLILDGFTMSVMDAALITVSLNAGAYLAEIFRSGIQAVPKGQTEAARSLGLGQSRTMVKVVLPQAVRISLPPMINQFIITIKDTSILSVLGLGDLTNKAKIYASATYTSFATYVYVGCFYLVIISVLMLLSRHLERSLNYAGKN